MPELSRRTLKERFSRTVKRRKLAWFSCLKYDFLDALAHDKFDAAKEIIDLFPDAVRWRGGSSPNGTWGEDSMALNTVLWSKDRGPKIHYLIDHGAEVNASGPHGYTALHRAVGINARDAIPALLARGADPDQPNAEGVTPRQLAKQHDEGEMSCGRERGDLLAFLEKSIADCAESNIASCTGGVARKVRALAPLRLRKR